MFKYCTWHGRPGLLTQIVVAKYADRTPVHRHEQIYRRAGAQWERATLIAWMRPSNRLLEPLSNVPGRYVRCRVGMR